VPRHGIGEGHKEEYYEVEDQRFLGEQGFAERIKERLGEEEGSLRGSQPIGMVIGALARGLGINQEILQATDRSWRILKARAMVGYALVQRFGYGLVEVATCLGRDIATVSSLISRLTSRMEADRDLRREVDRLPKNV
jgi:chromosomal replication initiation ATPase DnaA